MGSGLRSEEIFALKI